MKIILRIFLLGLISLLIQPVISSNGNKIIQVNEVSYYSGYTVTVEGTILRVGKSTNNTYFLNFTQDRGGFKVVIFSTYYSKFTAAGFDINAMEGQKVQVTGLVINDPQYGLEMILNDPAGQLILPQTAVSAKVATTLIPVNDVAKYVGYNGTVEGKVFKVGYSDKSNTYFLNFSEKRGGFTVVIFKSVVALFQKANINPKIFEGQKVQVTGHIKFDPQYGYEIILDKPENIRIVK